MFDTTRRTQPRWRSRSGPLLLGLLAAAAVTGATAGFVHMAQQARAAAEQPGPRSVSPAALALRFGIDRLRVVRTAAGHLLDLRYRVVDPVKAATFQRRGSRAQLVHERTGARLSVPTMPKAGSLRNSSPPQTGRTYFVLFANPGGLVQLGDRVSAVIDQLEARDLLVE